LKVRSTFGKKISIEKTKAKKIIVEEKRKFKSGKVTRKEFKT